MKLPGGLLLHRFFGFGTPFPAATRSRGSEAENEAEEALHENELVVDVGGVCWGYPTDSGNHGGGSIVDSDEHVHVDLDQI